MKEWQRKAYKAYFCKHCSILEAAEISGVCRQSASTFLKAQGIWEIEADFRRRAAAERRASLKRQWEFVNRIGLNLKREHEMAVLELSREKYY